MDITLSILWYCAPPISYMWSLINKTGKLLQNVNKMGEMEKFMAEFSIKRHYKQLEIPG